jgi:GNAT superfamily N-acetyltransferase
VSEVQYVLNPPADSEALNALFARAWAAHTDRDFSGPLELSLVYVCAYLGERLVGFVNGAWDGDSHAFLLDPTVDPEFQRRGIGGELVRRAADAARERGVEWLHVDYEPHLERFYRGAGFRETLAGLMRLRDEDAG